MRKVSLLVPVATIASHLHNNNNNYFSSWCSTCRLGAFVNFRNHTTFPSEAYKFLIYSVIILCSASPYLFFCYFSSPILVYCMPVLACLEVFVFLGDLILFAHQKYISSNDRCTLLLNFLLFISSCGEISYFQVIRHKSEKTTEVIYIILQQFFCCSEERLNPCTLWSDGTWQ